MFRPVIGLEVHAQVFSRTKLFSAAPVAFGALANSCVAPLDAGLPGALPSLNRRCVEAALAAGLAVNGQINLTSFFDRKHYFYQDLPLGYQITQKRVPIVRGGYIDVGPGRRIELEQIQLEQDSGKSVHDLSPSEVFVDLNRAGMALLEIVSAPQLRSGEEAARFLSLLSEALTASGACSIDDMDASTFRCDVNVSLHRDGEPWGTRVEVKNLNKTRAVRRAVDFEIERQHLLLARGAVVRAETRRFDAVSGETRAMRRKEAAMDYCFMPEPDLPPLRLTQEMVEEVRRALPVLPARRRQRLEALGVGEARAARLVRSPWALDALLLDCLGISWEDESSPKKLNTMNTVNTMNKEKEEKEKEEKEEKKEFPLDPAAVADLLLNDYAGERERGGGAVPAADLRALWRLEREGKVSGKAGKALLRRLAAGERDPEGIVASEGLAARDDREWLKALAREALVGRRAEAAKARQGDERKLNFLVGVIMRESKGRAPPAEARRIMIEMIEEDF